jgi:hypothetical protein
MLPRGTSQIVLPGVIGTDENDPNGNALQRRGARRLRSFSSVPDLLSPISCPRSPPISLLSFDSPYDRYKHGEAQAISPAARRGEALFFGEKLECYHCHGGPNFTDNNKQQGQAFPETGFHNTGLYNEDGKGSYKAWDHGLRDVTAKAEDEGAFPDPDIA